MENMPFVESWVVKRTGELHYLCRLCGHTDDDHGNEEEFRRHLSSWCHRIRIMQKEALFCKVCNLQTNYPSEYKKHVRTKAHLRNENPSMNPPLKCTACATAFLCKTEEARHLATPKHAKNVAKTDS